MKKNYNRDQFKRIFSFFAAVLLVGLYAAGFAWVWYESYSDAILLPFYRRGNWVMILIYVVLVLLFAKSFGGLKIGYLKRTDMFYSQTLSIFCVNVVTYFQISVVNRDFSAAVPMILLTIADLAVLILWIVLTNRLCFRLYPPRKLVVIYGDRNAAELVLKMSRRVDKYMICESVSANAPPEEIQEAIARYEGIILCEVSGKLRNDLIKYCFAQNVRAYIAPKISDIILRGAEEIRLFDTPLLLCRNYGLTFEQRLGKRIFDLVFAVVFLVLLSPLMLLSAIAIKLDDGGPVLFKQKRLTYHGKEFYVQHGGQRRKGRPAAGKGKRQPYHTGGTDPAEVPSGRTAPADQYPPRRYVCGGPPSGASGTGGGIRENHAGIRVPASGKGRTDWLCTGHRSV